MQSKFSILLSVLLMIVLTGCGRKFKESTQTTLIFSGAIAAAQTGGIMVYAHNSATNEHLGIKLSSENDGSTIQLDYGTWNFMAIGYDGGPFSGDIRCGFASGVNLQVKEATVSISISGRGCDHPSFGARNTRHHQGQIKPTTFYSCADQQSLDYADPGCIPGRAKSYFVSLPEFTGHFSAKTLTGAGISVCVTDNTPGTPEFISNLRLPTFSGAYGSPIPLQIRAYDEIGCSGGHEEYNFSNGLMAGNISDQSRARLFPYLGSNELYLKSNYCRNTALTNAPLANVNGTPGALDLVGMNYICTAEQLNAIAGMGAAAMNKKYYLAQDIDAAVLGNFTNFIGVGTPFTGTFYGGNHAIHNLTINLNPVTNSTGLFSVIDGPGTVSSLKFVNSNVSYTDNSGNPTGILAGSIEGLASIYKVSIEQGNLACHANASSSQSCGGIAGSVIEGVEIHGVEIQNFTVTVTSSGANTMNSVGGVVGNMVGTASSTSLRHVKASNLTLNVAGDTTYIENFGALVGQLYGEYAEVAVVNAQNIAVTAYNAALIGGLVGLMWDGSRLIMAKVTGTVDVSSDGSYAITGVGGVVGSTQTSAGANHVFAISSQMAVTNSDGHSSGMGTGGVIGFDGGDADFREIFASGSVQCSSLDCGGIIGSLGASSTLDFAVAENTVASSNNDFANVGGVAGISLGDIFNCAAKGNVASSNSGGVGGGIIGHLGPDGGLTNCYASNNVGGFFTSSGGGVGLVDASASVSNIYATGSVTSASGTAGAVFGFSNGSVSNVFYNSSISAMSDSYATSTTLSNQVNFTGWDFSTIWSLFGVSSPKLIFESPLNFFAGYKTGTELDPYVITTPTQLNGIRAHPFLMNKTFILASNLDMSGIANFIPIGTSTAPFTGNFFGNDKTISNLTINYPLVDRVGLFAVVGFDAMGGNGARIEHYDEEASRMRYLYLENVNVEGNNMVGALVGELTDIGSAYPWQGFYLGGVKVLSGTVHGNGQNVGGIAGHINSETSYSAINHLVNYANVSCSSGSQYYGGIAGQIGSATGTELYATELVNFGEVNCSSADYVGGIVGFHNAAGLSAVIDRAYNFGHVTANDYASGIAGTSNGTISSSACKNAQLTASSIAGGIIGQALGPDIEFSYSTCHINAVSGGAMIGEISGSADLYETWAVGTVNGSTSGAYIGANDGSASGSANASPHTSSFVTSVTPDNMRVIDIVDSVLDMNSYWSMGSDGSLYFQDEDRVINGF